MPSPARALILALALLAPALLAGCFRAENQVVVRNALDEAAWVDVTLVREGDRGTAFHENFTLEPGGEARRDVASGVVVYEVRIAASTGDRNVTSWQAGCGAACWLTVGLGPDGLSTSVRHAD